MDAISNRLLIGESRAMMRTLKPKIVQCVCTSPPYYGMRDYGIPPVLWADGTMAVLGLEPTLPRDGNKPRVRGTRREANCDAAQVGQAAQREAAEAGASRSTVTLWRGK